MQSIIYFYSLILDNHNNVLLNEDSTIINILSINLFFSILDKIYKLVFIVF
jgi:hypothetical protein